MTQAIPSKGRFHLVLFFWPLFALSAQAQQCDEQKIRDTVANHGGEFAPDIYYVTGALATPSIGREQAEQARKQVEADRKNFKPIDDHPQKISVSPSGDMAYEYGTRDGSWIDAQTGRAVTLHGSYLRVWKVADGKCVIAAMSARPEKPQAPPAAAPFDTSEYLLIGPGMQAPRALYAPNPVYSETARKAKTNGTVVVALAINEKGGVDAVKVVRHLEPGLDQNAMDAARQWKFAPATKDGDPVAVQLNVDMTFKLY